MTVTTPERLTVFDKLGIGFEASDGITASEAMEVVGSDYKVVKKPLYSKGDLDGMLEETPYFGLYREAIDADPHERILGSVTADYRITQNADIAEKLDLLAAQMPCVWHGHVNNGGKVFWMLAAGEFTVNGEPHQQNLLVMDNKQGQRSLVMMLAPIRIQCLNAFFSFKRSRIASASLQHRAGVEDELDFRLKLIAQIQRKQSDMYKEFEHLANTAISDDEFTAFLKSTYPDAQRPAKLQLAGQMTPDDLGAELMQAVNATNEDEVRSYEQAVALVARDRAGIRETFAMVNDTSPAIAGSRYAAFNAVTEYIQHLAPRRGGGIRTANAIVFGDEGKRQERAFEFLMKN